MAQICLNINWNTGYTHIAKNAIYIGNPKLKYIYENITLVGYMKIYNELELWKGLGMEDIQNRNIVVELYKKYGFEDMLELIEGDYSFILLDYNIHGEESWLYVARDPFGIYPLYHYENHPESEYIFSFIPEKYKPFTAGYYQKFIHSHKVSSKWKRFELPQSFYKLPFFSIYNDENNTDIPKQIDLAIKKRIDWIRYKYPEEEEEGIGCIDLHSRIRHSFVSRIPNTNNNPFEMAKYLAENMPKIKHVFLIEPFTYDWMEMKYLDRRKRLTQLYLDELMKDWTTIFMEYGIEIYMPFLDRILIQNIKPIGIL